MNLKLNQLRQNLIKFFELPKGNSMLKLYKRTIVISIWIFLACFILSVILDLFKSIFGFGKFIENYAIGIACSILVVIITTALQFKAEQRKLLYEFKKTFSSLISTLSLFESLTKTEIADLTEAQCNHFHGKIDAYFHVLDKLFCDLCWFDKRTESKFMEIEDKYHNIWIAFERPRFDSKRECITAASEQKKLIAIIDSAIAFLQDGFEKQQLQKIKDDIVNELSQNGVTTP